MKKTAALAIIIVLVMAFNGYTEGYGKSNILEIAITKDGSNPKQITDAGAKPADTVQTVISKNEAAKTGQTKSTSLSCPKNKYYPFAIHLVSLKTKPGITKELNGLKNKLSGLFITEIDLASGHWYRLDYGLFKSFGEADAKLDEIKKKALVDKNSFVGPKVDLTIELGMYSTKQSAEKQLSIVSQKGISAYIIEESQSCFRLVSGAYPDIKSAQTALKALNNAGFSPGLVKR